MKIINMYRGKFYKRIIELVKSQPILYDTTHPQYKNIFKKNKIWKQLGVKLNMSGDNVKQKWKNIRDTYSKHLRSIKAVVKSKNLSKYINWQWASEMEFLKDHIETTSDVLPIDSEVVPEMVVVNIKSELETGGSNDESTVPVQKHNIIASEQLAPSPITIPPPAPPADIARTRKKRTTDEPDTAAGKVISYFKDRANKLSPMEHLMMGYAKTMETFSERRQILTKMKIAQVMMEAELDEVQERQHTSLSGSHTVYAYTHSAQSDQITPHFTAEQNSRYVLVDLAARDVCEDKNIKIEIDETKRK